MRRVARNPKNEYGYNDGHVGRPSILASRSDSSDYAYCDCSCIFDGDGLGQSPGFREQYNSDPNAGFHVAQRNNALVFLHPHLAQLAFVAAGAWRIRQRPGVRVRWCKKKLNSTTTLIQIQPRSLPLLRTDVLHRFGCSQEKRSTTA